ncbi:aldehyde dehydrogenase (NAD+) [Caldalkalibacillus uzonensis]|uniref:Aldehyde dehydrogenase (NAD+) n=1 Tax=Caldalkalibacillus uzonensis TaxID=353224 RepID=A0ABU0CRZ3_9BACI|nr:alpha-ketoglutaric semialdehyde dehydrogenase GucD [Caldalkalibacillus uzonensis]MDQ0338280.1 aldehyde dehydrogenase (NAD+) [Caldalkalibacillus uzonensis]
MTQTYLNYINGEWKASASGQTIKSINPANVNEVVGEIQASTADDVQEAVQAAKAAQRTWKKMSGAERGNILYKAADILENRLEEIAETMTREMGKTLPEARGETMRGVHLLRYYAGEGLRKVGDVIPSMDGKTHIYTTRVPLGVVGIITPWNFPVAIPIWKIAPALIYGNTVVFKPASDTGVTAAKVVEVFAQAGLPKGVLNFVTGSGSRVGNAIIEHNDIHGISFTGSNSTGRYIAQTAAARGVKYQLEMGGKNPAIVDEECDLDLAVTQVINGAMKSTGQKCTATSRALIHRNIYEQFKTKLLDEVQKITIGDGLQDGVWMGPVANKNQLDTILTMIEKGKSEGGKILFGGEVPEGEQYKNGYFIQPTVFESVSPKAEIAQEEIFGPVLVLIPVDSLEEAFEIANDVRFGLSASLFTTNVNKALSFIDEIDAGMVRINGETAGVEPQAPFGGMKESSSHSREQGRAAIEFYTSIKTVSICR